MSEPKRPATLSRKSVSEPVRKSHLSNSVSDNGSPIRPQSMDRIPSSGGLTDLPGRGLHMPPEALGQAESPISKVIPEATSPLSTNHTPVVSSSVNAKARRRANDAVKASQSQAASAAAAKNCAAANGDDSSMMTFVTFGGMEIVFSTAKQTIVGVCSRTHFILQTLHLISDASVVSLTSNPVSGLLVVAHQDGIVQTYVPVPADPEKVMFGKYLWKNGLTIDTGKVFYASDERPQLLDRRKSVAGQLVDISSSNDYKLLVGHRTQLAVFEATPHVDPASPRSSAGRLLWTTVLPTNVVTTKISGDGQAIVVVLENDTDGESLSHGARTFVHDLEDGSFSGRPALERSSSIGMVFKPGPFLKHDSPITRISFRGFGRVTSSIDERGVGNDLLLTYCESDSAVRIFNQNGWRQLMLWAVPPNSRADWIRGSLAFNLGDLENGSKTSKGSRVMSRRSSGESTTENVNAALQNALSDPTVAAGAWIAELTFRDAFPALRLSRLSYMKRGNDDAQPAHFESVAAILPAGSISMSSVLQSDDMGLSIQGVWPAWNPWLSEATKNVHDQTLRGSAMEFLGLSTVPPTHSQQFGESHFGGTHSPPTELRILSSHIYSGNVVLMEFPLWGDHDFGAMELGSPVRNVLSLSDIFTDESKSFNETQYQSTVSMDYASSRLCATIEGDRRSISLIWRKESTQSLYSPHSNQTKTQEMKSLGSPVAKAEHWMEDRSAIVSPLVLPTLKLPNGPPYSNEEQIMCIKWLPDDSFEGPPLLLAVTQNSSLVVFELPPPQSCLEPFMPNFDPSNPSSHGINDDIDIASTADMDEEPMRSEYEVIVTPHPDFGLGLRLESPMDGLPAIAGSFKKHPLNGGMLPAEKTGMILLGDELLNVNGTSLENMTFDDIISTVRHVGAEVGPGQPLILTFRPTPLDRSRRNSAVLHESFKPIETTPSAESDATVNRRLILGIESKPPKFAHRRKRTDDGSLATMLVGNSGESQQEFGRAIAVVENAIEIDLQHDASEHFIVIPCGQRQWMPSTEEHRSTAIIIVVQGNSIQTKQLVIPYSSKAALLNDLGSYELPLASNIRSIQAVPSSCNDLSFTVVDDVGRVSLLFLNVNDEAREKNRILRPSIRFRSHFIFNLADDPFRWNLKARDLSTFVSYEMQGDSTKDTRVVVWTSRSDPLCRLADSDTTLQSEFSGEDYVQDEIILSAGSSLVDVVFLNAGDLDVFPTLLLLLSAEAILYQMCSTGTKWVAIARVRFPWIPSSLNFDRSDVKIQISNECLPHFIPMIQSAVPLIKRNSTMLSDWNPESMLALLCCDQRGTQEALHLHLKRNLILLSELVESSSSYTNILSGHSTLFVIPSIDNDRSGFSSGSSSKNIREFRSKLDRLVSIIENPMNHNKSNFIKEKSTDSKSATTSEENETINTEKDLLPPIFDSLSQSELRVLWATIDLVRQGPDYGKIDMQGTFAMSIFDLYKSLKRSPKEKSSSPSSLSTYAKPQLSFFQRHRSTLKNRKEHLFPQCASSAGIAAFISDYQGTILNDVRESGKKFDWESVRSLRMPFWVRSDEKLRQLSEEVGQALFRESRDIMKAAIFFLAAGKCRTLRNLAATDSTESGKKFYKFLTSFDFSSDRGRSAAEKNAYSLLRKNKYDCAAAFFLLAEPPLLKSAVETIAAKMKDFDLAFMVSRLLRKEGTKQAIDNSKFGTQLMGFSGMLGGGGGYAGSTSSTDARAKRDDQGYFNWRPDLSSESIDLIKNRILPEMYHDSTFCGLLHLWLGRHEEGWHWMSGLVECTSGIMPTLAKHPHLPRLAESTTEARASQDPTITLVNSFINAASSPLLLKYIKAAPRTRLSSVMSISSSLAKLGLELPALLCLTQVSDGDISFEKLKNENDGHLDSKNKSSSDHTVLGAKNPVNLNIHSSNDESSIFDSFDAPQPTPVPASAQPLAPSNGGMESSIFDDFEAPRPKPPTSKEASVQKVGQNHGGMESSIFDSFDAPQPTPVPASAQPLAPSNGGMESSIFDDFEAPRPEPPTSKEVSVQKVGQNHGGMESSIFDSFDAPQTRSLKSVPVPGTISSKENTESRNIQATALSLTHEDRTTIPMLSIPDLWKDWCVDLGAQSAARRAIRELITICSRFNIKTLHSTTSQEIGKKYQRIPSSMTQALHLHLDGKSLIRDSKDCIRTLVESYDICAEVLMLEALRILKTSHEHRIFLIVLLWLSFDEFDAAEDVVRSTAQDVIGACGGFALLNDEFKENRSSIARICSFYQRQKLASLSWELEMCLWMHKGGALPLSGLVLNETICAGRIGILIASWNQDFDSLEALLQQPPDCIVDDIVGRQLCVSLKILSSSVVMEKQASTLGSGGWEFLVECKRAEATDMLRGCPTGSFIIRPHQEDHGVFTLSFKTNLKPSEDSPEQEVSNDEAKEEKPASKIVKRDEVVQHAIVRLSDSGFRCGSFGPFATLLHLLEAVSNSLPFKLRFDLPPIDSAIHEDGSKPSPNCALFRKIGLLEGKRTNSFHSATFDSLQSTTKEVNVDVHCESVDHKNGVSQIQLQQRRTQFGRFLELLVLSGIRKQLSCVAAAKYDHQMLMDSGDESIQNEFDEDLRPEQEYKIAVRILRPLLTWCRMLEIRMEADIAPQQIINCHSVEYFEHSTNRSEFPIAGDKFIRKMIKSGSGVEFRTLRLGEGGDTAMVVLFSKKEAVDWFMQTKFKENEEEAIRELNKMEYNRVIESVDFSLLSPKTKKALEKRNGDETADRDGNETSVQGIRYRLVDPWEVEPLANREGETRGATLGRHRLLSFGLRRVSASCEDVFRSMGGAPMLDLWASANGGMLLTKAIATVHPPWERGAGGDISLEEGVCTEADPYGNSIRQHLYRNSLFRRLELPQRFIALIQVELLDLKNLTSPGGSLSLTVYSLLRLKRPNSRAPLTMKARTLDSAATQPAKLGKATGPNAPASWGSLVRFRFPLPENTSVDGKSYDRDRESLFKGPPSVLQLSVYEKKFMTDTLLGGADVKLDGLSSGGQLEEWVPLRTETHGIKWFARIRLTLRFELMCLSQMSESYGTDAMAPSVGLRRIQELSSIGGLQEDVRKSVSTQDLFSYFENML